MYLASCQMSLTDLPKTDAVLELQMHTVLAISAKETDTSFCAFHHAMPCFQTLKILQLFSRFYEGDYSVIQAKSPGI